MLGPVSTRPRAGLARVLEDLGTTLLELACAPPELADEIAGVVIHDPLDEPALLRQALVLGIGTHGPGEIAELLASLGPRGAAGLVVRAPVAVDGAVAEAVRRSGVALLALTRGASWVQLTAMLRSLTAEGDVGEPEPQTLGGMPAGDLFALANAIAALLDAPVTIEDRNSRVLAFSSQQDADDRSRVETILGRQVPQRLTRLLEQRGTFREMYRGDHPIFIEPGAFGLDDSVRPRVALAVRAGDEILGSIWAVVREPLTPERNQAFCDAAKLVALHMMRLRAGADVERRLRTDLVSTALEGGPGAPEAVRRLGLADQPGIVLALAVADGGGTWPTAAEQAELVAQRQHLADAFAVHLSAAHPRSAAALVGDVVYGIVPTPGEHGDGEDRGARVAAEFLERIGDRLPLRVGVGSPAADGAGLARSRAEADRALRVLRAATGARAVARSSDVHVEALLLELGDLNAGREDRPTGPVGRLLAYDAEHRSRMVETVRAWLDAFGDVNAAAAAVYVHPNTFRYRLRRLTEVCGVDLTDPDVRFAAMLELRLLQRRPAN